MKTVNWFTSGISALALVGCASIILQGCAFVPPRTIAATQEQFDDDASLIIGQSTAADIERALGSPSQIRKETDGSKTFVYVKTRGTTAIFGTPLDAGTTYTAEYTVTSDGKLKGKDYRATPITK